MRLSSESNNEDKKEEEEEEEKDLPKSLSEGALETIAEEREEEEAVKLIKSGTIKTDNCSISKKEEGNDKEKDSEVEKQTDQHVITKEIIGDSRGGHVTSVRVSRGGAKKSSPPRNNCSLSSSVRKGHKIGVVTLELDSSRYPGRLQDDKRYT